MGYVPVYFLLRRKTLGPGGKISGRPKCRDMDLRYNLIYKNSGYSQDYKGNILEYRNRDIDSGIEEKEYSLEYESLSGRFFIVFISFYTGFFIITNFMMILCLVRIPLRFEYFFIFSLVFVPIALYLYFCKRFRYRESHRKKKFSFSFSRSNFSRRKPINILFSIIILLISFNFLVVIFFTFLFPIRFWDAIACWSLKGKAFFLDSDIFSYFTQHEYEFSHLSYPLYLSLIQTWIYGWLGKVDEVLVKIIFPLFYLSCLFILYYFFRKKLTRLLSATLVLVFSSIPVVVNHGYIEYANLLFGVVLMLATYFFYLWNLWRMEEKKGVNRGNGDNEGSGSGRSVGSMSGGSWGSISGSSESSGRSGGGGSGDVGGSDDFGGSSDVGSNDGSSYLLLSALFFSLLAFVRSEGILLLCLFIVLNAGFFLSDFFSNIARLRLCHRAYRKIDNYTKTIIPRGTGIFIFSILLVVFLLLPWFLLRYKLGLPLVSIEWTELLKNKNGGNILASFSWKRAFYGLIKEFGFSSYDSARGFFSSFYGPIWVIFLILFLANIKRLFLRGGWICFIFLAFGFIMIFVSVGFIYDFTFSLDRYLLHLFPLSYLWIFSNQSFKSGLNANLLEIS